MNKQLQFDYLTSKLLLISKDVHPYEYSAWFHCTCSHGFVAPVDDMAEAVDIIVQLIDRHRATCKKKSAYAYINNNWNNTRTTCDAMGIEHE